MAYSFEKRTITSTDGVHELVVKVFRPEGEVKGLFQVVHGMQEYIGRYESFMAMMAENGYLCFGHDHIGHGDTAKETGDFGFFASKDGWKIVVDDVYRVGSEIKKDFPEQNIILMGHSMGSFIVRLSAADHADFYHGLVVMGTGGPNPLAGIGIGLAGLIGTVRGEKHISPLIEKMAFGAYNKRWPEEAPLGWLSRKKENVEKYAADPYCSFHFTVSALRDLVTMNKKCNEKAWFDRIVATGLPLFFVSGADDPVGDWSKGVLTVKSELEKRGVKNLRVKLYPEARHEILNDLCADEVLADLLAWANETI